MSGLSLVRSLVQVLGQRFAIARRERDQLRDRFQDSVKQAQQKSGFRNLILERKLGGLAEEAEKRDACVNEVRRSAGDDDMKKCAPQPEFVTRYVSFNQY